MQRERSAGFPRRRRIRLACIAVLAAVVAVGALKYYVGPRLLISGARRQLGRMWDGEVAVARADFDFTSPSRLFGLELTDRSGRRWLHVQTVTLSLKGLARLSPSVASVDLDGVECDLHVVDGRCRPPVLKGEGDGGGGGLRRLTARGVSLRVTGAEGGMSVAIYDGLSLRVEREGAGWVFALSRER